MSAVDLSLLPALSEGTHYDIDGGMCVMEAVAYMAGEPWSDAPVCACPVISDFLSWWNDSLDDISRDRHLRPLILLMIGTKSTAAVEQRRAVMITDWLIRCQAPTWLYLAGLEAEAEALECLPEITNVKMLSTTPVLRAVRNAGDAAYKAWNASSTFNSVASQIVQDVAEESWQMVAGGAAWSACARESNPSANSAMIATHAIKDSIRIAAVSGISLAPTVATLQKSALDLVHRMISVTETAT